MGDPILTPSAFSTMVRELESNGSDTLLINSLLDSLNVMITTGTLSSSEEGSNRTIIASMGKLLSIVDSDGALAWGVINVLENYFNTSVSDITLNEIKKLTPTISKLAVAAKNDERKVSLLKVLETLTYGIKLLWPESFLFQLFSTLIEWSKSANTTVIQLSLSVIANLLHQNNVAISILMQTVNLKAFMNNLLQIRGNILCKMEVCKLMFLLGDLTYEKPEEEEVINFIKVSLCTILEASKCENRSQLHHCISFFADTIKSKKISVQNLNQPWIPDSVCKIVHLLESGLDTMKPDIAMLLFRFLGILLALHISSLSDLNMNIMKLGVSWVRQHTVKASEAISTMYLILIHQCAGSNPMCGLTAEDLASVFIPLLQITPTSRDGYLFITSLLKLFTVALDVKPFNVQLQSSLTNEVVELFLMSIPTNFNLWNDYPALEHIVEMYVHLFVFVNKIGTSCCDPSWMKSCTLWLREQKVLSLLAVALICGSSDIKGHVLSLVSSVGFPGDCVSVLAKAMADGGKGYLASNNHNHDHFHESYRNSFSSNMSMLSEVKNIVRSTKNKNGIISGDKILKLYEYNDFVNADIQKSLSSSLRTLTEYNSFVEEKMYLGNQILNQFREKYEQLQPEFEHVCAKYEDANKKIQSYIQEISLLKDKLSQETSNCRITVQSLKETSQRQEKELQILKEQLMQKEAIVASQQEELESVQREGNAKVSALKEKEEQLEDLNSNLKKEIAQLELVHKQARERVAQLENDKVVKEKEIQELQRIRDTVFELTGGRKKF